MRSPPQTTRSVKPGGDQEASFGEDAFAEPWRQHLPWANPPFNMISKVLTKVREDQAHAVIAVPDWPRRRWHRKLLDMRIADLLIFKNTKLFTLNGEKCGGTLWDTRIALVCGHTQRCSHLFPQTLLASPLKTFTFAKTSPVIHTITSDGMEEGGTAPTPYLRPHSHHHLGP